jgi:hypothetical protein
VFFHVGGVSAPPITLSKTSSMKRSSHSQKRSSYWQTQFVYILWNIPFIWIIKIGITSRTIRKRRREIGKSAPGWDIPIFFLPLPAAKKCEDIMKKMFSWAQVPFYGSGKTERFNIIVLVPALSIMIFWFLFYWAFVIVAGLAFLYLFM